MDRGERCHLGAGDRVSDERRVADPLRVHEGADVLDESAEVVAGRRRFTRLLLATPREADRVKPIDELRREAIEPMDAVSKPREEQQRLATSAPIEVVQADALHRHELV